MDTENNTNQSATRTQQPAAPNNQAPTPPPPVITADNWSRAMQEQYTQSITNYNRAQELEARIAKMEKDYSGKLAEYTDKVNAYDTTAGTLGKYVEYGKAELKRKFDSLDKQFVEQMNIKYEDLEKDPLNGFAVLDEKAKLYNNIKEALAKTMAPPADGTDGAPAGNTTAPTMRSYSDVRKEIFRRQTQKGE